MRAAVLENKIFHVEEVPSPELKEGEKGAIIKVLGCGLCGSDIVKINTGRAKDGAVLGHEVVGDIIKINSDTDFKVGNKVALGHHIPCFKCNYCLDEHYSMCHHFKSTNIIPGGFAEYIFVSEEHLNNTVFKVSDNLNDIEASFLEPLSCCIRAVKRADIKENSKSLVIGLGSIGLLMGQAINALGHKAYGCDLLQDRVELSEKYNFEKSFKLENLDKAKEIAPDGFDRVFLTAGSHHALPTAIKYVRDGGNIIVFSSVKTDDGFTNNDIYYRELTIMGSYSPSPNDLKDSMDFLNSGKVKVTGLSEIYGLDRLNEAVSDTISNKIMKAYIKI